MTKTKKKMKTVFIVRKHITNYATGKELRYEDYPNQFDVDKLADAESFMAKKQQKYLETVEDYNDEGSTITEGRRYEVVPIEVPT